MNVPDLPSPQASPSFVKKLLRIFLAGVAVVVPFAISIYVILRIGGWLDNIGYAALAKFGLEFAKASREEGRPPVLGALIVLVGIFLVGLLTHFWLFNRMVGVMERLFRNVPGVKTIYESVRDLMKLFGRDSHRMGRAVLYSPPGSGASLLAILTSEHPAGLAGGRDGQDMVTLYLPFAYMIGGPVLYVPRAHIREVDMPVEKALKLAATAQVGFDPTVLDADPQTEDAAPAGLMQHRRVPWFAKRSGAEQPRWVGHKVTPSTTAPLLRPRASRAMQGRTLPA